MNEDAKLSSALFADDITSAVLQAEIVNRLRIHTEMVMRLLDDPTTLPPNFSAFLEDVGNAYIDIADEVNRQIVRVDASKD
jgi:hypothetical protein